ncbi:MAG: hypothetical protein K6A41_04125 [Bacteroidales bacterium]|nr:hypothetical protein [Bacteroidales bacterium]
MKKNDINKPKKLSLIKRIRVIKNIWRMLKHDNKAQGFLIVADGHGGMVGNINVPGDTCAKMVKSLCMTNVGFHKAVTQAIYSFPSRLI